jgi:hypothetical protein
MKKGRRPSTAAARGNGVERAHVAAPARTHANAIDQLMERASEALMSMRYFEAERLASRGLASALAKGDFGRIARITLPLQEARRQIRQLACDACPELITGVLEDFPRRPLSSGCYLAQPPLTAMDARSIRRQAWDRDSCAILMTREPLTRDGLWPIAAVGVGELTVTTRIKVTPPVEVTPQAGIPTRDVYTRLPGIRWFEATLEALGDRAIASLPTGDPPAHRVMDLIERLDACPEHEKLHQALAAECRRAADAPEPRLPRRRGPGAGLAGF